MNYWHARSWLLVSAAHNERFDATSTGADAVVLDLEDGTPLGAKEAARHNVRGWLGSGHQRAWVRISATTTDEWLRDLDAIAKLDGLSGVVLAKTELSDHVTATAEKLFPETPIVALIESAVGIENAIEIARCPQTSRLAFGSGDFRRDTGMSDDPIAMAYPRTRLTVASRAAGLPGPIDGPTRSDLHDDLQAQTADAVRVGMTGRLCLRPDQAAVVNEYMAPSPEEVCRAREIIAACAETTDPSNVPRVAQARRVVELAKIFS